MSGWITEYFVATAGTQDLFSKLITEMIADKWQPHGGPMVHDGTIAQAMVKMDNTQGDQIAYDIHELNHKTHQT